MLKFFIVINFCKKNNIILDLNKNINSNNFANSAFKKIERPYSNKTNKNELNGKYNKTLEFLKNKNYTMKYIGEKMKHRNVESDGNTLMNFTIKNISPQNFSKIDNKSSSYFNKVNNIIMNRKNKNRFKKNDYNNNDLKELKINNVSSSSYNNNFTNIKTNKIVFIDLNNEQNQNENNGINNEKFKNNDKIILNSNRNKSNQNGKKSNSPKDNNKQYNQLPFYNNSNNNILKNNNINYSLVEKKQIKFPNLIIQKLEESNQLNNCSIFVDKTNNKNTIEIIEKEKNNLHKLKIDKNLSNKECAYYILSKSPMLTFFERIIFSRSTQNLRNILSKETIFNDNKKFLRNQIEELKQKIILCDKVLDTPFMASKTAEITLNFITYTQEIEFQEYPIYKFKNEEKALYNNYIKILYYLLNEEMENNDEENDNSVNQIENLRKKLYLKINEKDYKTIKDYLYNIFIKKKEYIKEIPKIDEINNIINQNKNMFGKKNSLQICKFISFTMYLIKEIINFGNKINSTFELKIKAKSVMDIIIQKLKKS